MLINDPATIAELRALYPRYEEALISNNVETLMSMFWASPYVARFGPTETLYGISEIEAFRKGRSPANLARTVKRVRRTDETSAELLARLGAGWVSSELQEGTDA